MLVLTLVSDLKEEALMKSFTAMGERYHHTSVQWCFLGLSFKRYLHMFANPAFQINSPFLCVGRSASKQSFTDVFFSFKKLSTRIDQQLRLHLVSSQIWISLGISALLYAVSRCCFIFFLIARLKYSQNSNRWLWLRVKNKKQHLHSQSRKSWHLKSILEHLLANFWCTL